MRLFLAYILYIILQTGLNEFPRQATSQLFPSQCVYTRNESAQARKDERLRWQSSTKEQRLHKKMLRKMHIVTDKIHPKIQ